MKAWKRIEPTVPSKVGFRPIITKTFQMPDGTIAHFETINTEGTQFAGVIAITKDKKVVIARQFRPGPERIFDDIPGGGVEAGEDPIAAAARELEEETGYRPGKIEPLGVVCKDAYNNALYHYFLATDCELTETGQQLEVNEYVEVRLIDVAELIDNAKHTRMSDSEAVFLAYDKLMHMQGGQ